MKMLKATSVVLSLWIMILLSILVSNRGVSQTFTAELSGIVSDPSGAVVAGAVVRAVNVDTNGVTETRTNDHFVHRL